MKPRLEQVHLKNIADKTVVLSVPHSSGLLLVFADKTYAYLNIDYGYGDDPPELDDIAGVDLASHKDEDLLACGMVTQEDIDERDAKKRKKENGERQAREDQEYRSYLNLKAKFEPRDEK
jgi:hypothetical protein